MVNLDRWNFAWPALGPSAAGKVPRAVALKEATWKPGYVIKISFLDDDHGLKEMVKEVAATWTTPFMANLTFDFVEDSEGGVVRISFRQPGSWSMIGTTCRYITAKKKPTVNFGWLNAGSSEDEVRRVVLHEFGHVLGLVHEHQNPAGKIRWNKRQVITDLYPRWTLEEIEDNVFRPYEEKETNFTEPDYDSIMVYPIPARWTEDGFCVDLNTDLSPMDRQFIVGLYG